MCLPKNFDPAEYVVYRHFYSRTDVSIELQSSSDLVRLRKLIPTLRAKSLGELRAIVEIPGVYRLNSVKESELANILNGLASSDLKCHVSTKNMVGDSAMHLNQPIGDGTYADFAMLIEDEDENARVIKALLDAGCKVIEIEEKKST